MTDARDRALERAAFEGGRDDRARALHALLRRGAVDSRVYCLHAQCGRLPLASVVRFAALWDHPVALEVEQARSRILLPPQPRLALAALLRRSAEVAGCAGFTVALACMAHAADRLWGIGDPFDPWRVGRVPRDNLSASLLGRPFAGADRATWEYAVEALRLHVVDAALRPPQYAVELLEWGTSAPAAFMLAMLDGELWPLSRADRERTSVGQAWGSLVLAAAHWIRSWHEPEGDARREPDPLDGDAEYPPMLSTPALRSTAGGDIAALALISAHAVALGSTPYAAAQAAFGSLELLERIWGVGSAFMFDVLTDRTAREVRAWVDGAGWLTERDPETSRRAPRLHARLPRLFDGAIDRVATGQALAHLLAELRNGDRSLGQLADQAFRSEFTSEFPGDNAGAGEIRRI